MFVSFAASGDVFVWGKGNSGCLGLYAMGRAHEKRVMEPENLHHANIDVIRKKIGAGGSFPSFLSRSFVTASSTLSYIRVLVLDFLLRNNRAGAGNV